MATPIGNLEDITIRALRVLGQVSVIAAEDTRTTRKLLSHYSIKARTVSFHERNKSLRIPGLLRQLQTEEVALVSEAGMPTISDPGRELVEAAAAQGIPVVPIPGPSALTSAFAVSGFPGDSVRFMGFLPRRKGERRAALKEAAASAGETLVLFEAPHRLAASLTDMLDVLGDRRLVVCRELTKLHEELFRGTVSEAIDWFSEPRGEFTLVLEGVRSASPEVDTEATLRDLDRYKSEGLRAREAVGRVMGERGISRQEAYRLWLSIDKSGDKSG